MIDKDLNFINPWKLFLCLCAFSLPYASSIEDKCEACKIVARELISRLESEGPRNHIDMRHRIDDSGQRSGKVIEYRLSELRIVELFEDICEVAYDYSWGYRNPNDGSPMVIGWVHKDAEKEISMGLSKSEKKTRISQLHSYCGRLIEEHEDDIAGAIRKGFKSESGYIPGNSSILMVGEQILLTRCASS